MSVRPESPASAPPRGPLPTLSLVTCSFQQGRYLEQTMRSVLDQKYPGLEYVVIDGGSKDESVSIIRKYTAELSYWVSEPDHGQTDALIKGFRRTSGDIMGWLCSDDLLLPGALATVGRFFADNPNVMAAYGDALWIDGDGRFIRPKKEAGFNRFVFLYDHNYVPQPSMFWRRSLHQSVGGLDTRFDLAMDADLWDRFSQITPIARIPAYLSCMRFYPAQKTLSRRGDGRREDAAIRSRQSEQPGWMNHALHFVARGMRVCAKVRQGGYWAAVPAEHIEWLQRSSSTERAG
ncbi:MAG TPA: glycosyltransferase family 2 protein [Burkholderiales bacterium]|nr:glycosyltransferase family 2 protein [Burkholderiales bacterium]